MGVLMNTLVDIVEKHLIGSKGINFYHLEGGEAEVKKSYLEIVRDAKTLAAFLVERFEPQSRILLVYS